MTVVLGSATVGAEAAQIPTLEKGIAIRVEAKCIGTVKVKKIALKFSGLGSGSNKVILGVREDSAGAVGAFMAETGALTAAATTEGELTSEISVTNGTFYWLCLVVTEQTGTACKIKSAAGETKKTTGAVKKISEGTWTGALLKYTGTEPGFWAEEVEGGTTFTGSLLGSLALATAISGVKIAAAALTTKVAFVSSLAGRKLATGSVTGPLAVTTTLTGTIPGSGPSFSGALNTQLAVKGAVTGRKIATGELPPWGFTLPFEVPFLVGYPPGLAITTTLSGAKLGRGSLAQPIALKNASVTGRKIGTALLTSSAAIRTTTSGRKTTTATLSDKLAIVTTLLGPSLAAQPIRMRLSSRKQLSMTLTSRPQVDMELGSRPQLEMTLEAR